MNTAYKGFRSARASRSTGFSLIEALIAALVLATGLMALAALQSNLARNTADARSRSQVAGFLERIIERQRAEGGGAGYQTLPATSLWTTADITAIENSAGISGLAVTTSCIHYVYNEGTGLFVNTGAACGGSTAASADSQYKEITLVATWNDALGELRRFELTSSISPRTVGDSTLPYSTPTNGNQDAISPVVRQDTPAEAGVIPIAIGDGSDTAATNPKPKIESGQVIRTSYEVLTYRNEDTSTVRAQRRVETAVIGCQCSPNAAPTGAFSATAQWPAYWNGERYIVYSPGGTATPPGQTAGTGPAAVVQDELCTDCCRDHHDAAGSTHVKFDPFRTDSHRHFKFNSSTGDLELAGASDIYLEACRMIRVDGFWRTAQDLDIKHFGLLKTTTQGLDLAKSALIDTTAQSLYEEFAIAYLKSNYVAGETAQSADTVYATKGLNDPSNINIRRPSPADERYLHARALYVDFLESDARAKIDAELSACTRTNREECVLPFLPFTSINVTEPAFWEVSDPATLTVQSSGFVVFNPTAPNRGRVNALSTAAADAVANIVPNMRPSNSGLAVRPRGIDVVIDSGTGARSGDDIRVTDTQQFTVKAGASTAGDFFQISISGLPQLSDGNFGNAPAAAPRVGTLAETDCVSSTGGNPQLVDNPNPYKCYTSTTLSDGTTTVPGRLILRNYNNELTEDRTNGNNTVTITCESLNGGAAGTLAFKGAVRYCQNYQVNTAALVGSTGVLVGGDGTLAETSVISFSNILQGSSIAIPFTLQGETIATASTCDSRGQGSATFKECP